MDRLLRIKDTLSKVVSQLRPCVRASKAEEENVKATESLTAAAHELNMTIKTYMKYIESKGDKK